jgi:hypothetical protein
MGASGRECEPSGRAEHMSTERNMDVVEKLKNETI